jgi:hypothetical protein
MCTLLRWVYSLFSDVFRSNHVSVLDPRKKLAYFTKNWDKELQAAALANMEETVCV